MTRPLLAVAPVRFGAGQIGSWTDSGEAVQSNYLQALRRAGAVPVAVGAPDDIELDELLEPFAGVVLVGGADVDPRCYGAEPDPRDYGIDDSRDTYELALARAALRRELPLLAICRGEQVLNVACGGTLWQHVPDLGGDVDHGRPTAPSRPTRHPVRIEPGSRLAALNAGQPELADCISIHHQAVRTVGPPLVVTATAADGVIEAIETPPDHPSWCLGVQWHPERSAATDPAQQQLFDGFVEVCRARGLVPSRSEQT